MDFQDLGSAGELLGAIATLITLLYFASQIRSNTEVVRAEGRRSHFAIGRENNQMLIRDRDVAELLLRGLGEPLSLDGPDQTRFTFLMASFLNNAELGFLERESGVIDQFEADRAIRAWGKFLRAPGGQDFWSHYADNYHPEFRKVVDAMLEEATRPASP